MQQGMTAYFREFSKELDSTLVKEVFRLVTLQDDLMVLNVGDLIDNVEIFPYLLNVYL